MVHTDKKQLVKLLSFMVTFDGGLYMKKKNASFIMNMREENRDYLEWVQETLLNVTGCTIKQRPDYNNDGYNRQPQLRLESGSHPLLTRLHNRIYIDRRKVIDPHMLKLLDAEALAIIFMADGGSQLETRFKNPHAYISLHTKGFSYNDNLALGRAIYENCGVFTNVRRHNKYYFLALPKKTHNHFIHTILPFMKKSFLYKLEKLTPAMGEDIVCSLRERREALGNSKPS